MQLIMSYNIITQDNMCRLAETEDWDDVIYDHPHCKEDQIQQQIHPSQAYTGNYVSSTAVGNVGIAHDKKLSNCDQLQREAAFGNIGHTRIRLSWKHRGIVHAGIAR